jgi:VanZ family protein
MKTSYFIRYWVPVILYSGFIFYLSSLPNPLKELTPSSLFLYFDFQKFVYHIVEYAILSFLLYRALKITSKSPQILAILITIIYGILDEIHQFYVPGRIASVFDVAINSFGAVLAQCIINIYNLLKS